MRPRGQRFNVVQRRFLRSSARKARVVVNMIRGHRVAEALDLLRYSRKGLAPELAKLLESGVANIGEQAKDSAREALTMSFSRATGATFMPLLSRIVLGSAFLLSGWYHCFSTASFTPAEQDRINQMQASGDTADPSLRLVVLQDGDDAPVDAAPAEEREW